MKKSHFPTLFKKRKIEPVVITSRWTIKEHQLINGAPTLALGLLSIAGSTVSLPTCKVDLPPKMHIR